MKKDKKFIRRFDEINIKDIPIVGGKNASLGDMYQELTPKGIKIPNGFAITAEAYWHVLKSNKMFEKLKDTMKGLNKNDVKDLSKRGKTARNLILSTGIPIDLWEEIVIAYEKNSM